MAETNKPYSDQYMDAMTLLSLIARNHKIAVDAGDEIFEEYEPHMPFGSYAREWWIHLAQFQKISFFSSHVPRAVENRLIGRLKFDSDDLKFVGVASRTSTRQLVSKDSEDYDQDVVDCLKERLGINFYDIPTACSACP